MAKNELNVLKEIYANHESKMGELQEKVIEDMIISFGYEPIGFDQNYPELDEIKGEENMPPDIRFNPQNLIVNEPFHGGEGELIFYQNLEDAINDPGYKIENEFIRSDLLSLKEIIDELGFNEDEKMRSIRAYIISEIRKNNPDEVNRLWDLYKNLAKEGNKVDDSDLIRSKFMTWIGISGAVIFLEAGNLYQFKIKLKKVESYSGKNELFYIAGKLSNIIDNISKYSPDFEEKESESQGNNDFGEVEASGVQPLEQELSKGLTYILDEGENKEKNRVLLGLKKIIEELGLSEDEEMKIVRENIIPELKENNLVKVNNLWYKYKFLAERRNNLAVFGLATHEFMIWIYISRVVNCLEAGNLEQCKVKLKKAQSYSRKNKLRDIILKINIILDNSEIFGVADQSIKNRSFSYQNLSNLSGNDFSGNSRKNMLSRIRDIIQEFGFPENKKMIEEKEKIIKSLNIGESDINMNRLFSNYSKLVKEHNKSLNNKLTQSDLTAWIYISRIFMCLQSKDIHHLKIKFQTAIHYLNSSDLIRMNNIGKMLQEIYTEIVQ